MKWLRERWASLLVALGGVILGLTYLWHSLGSRKALDAAEELGEARGKTGELEQDITRDLKIAQDAAQDRAQGAAELEAVRESIREEEAHSGALSATELADEFNRRKSER